MKEFSYRILLSGILTATGTSVASEDVDILFLGNSYTARHDLPALVEQVLEEGDPDTNVNVSRVIYGGQNMFKHSTYYYSQSFIEQSTITNEEIEARIEKMKSFLTSEKAPNEDEWNAHWASLRPGKAMPFAGIHSHMQSAIKNHQALLAKNPRTVWEYVVLQSWRDVSPDPDQAYAKYASRLAKIARKQGADVILYMTSPETQNKEPVSAPYSPESADRDLAIGLELVRRIQPKAVVHVPLAIKNIQTGGTDLLFRYVNDGHPNQTCAFLTSNLFYAALTGKSSEGFDYDTVIETKAKHGKDPDGGELKVVFDNETKTYLQKAAFEAAQEFKRLAKTK